ncbi:MAG: DUF3768 domain-containing protein [Pseudomonadota bacterium]
MVMTDDDRTRDCARIAEQNDAFRRRQPGGGQGEVVATRAVNDEGPEFVAACLEAVASYDDFNEENDPFGTHEMGFMEVQGKKVWWKLDLYDRAYENGSPNPTSLADTRRVLTVLFPSDY